MKKPFVRDRDRQDRKDGDPLFSLLLAKERLLNEIAYGNVRKTNRKQEHAWILDGLQLPKPITMPLISLMRNALWRNLTRLEYTVRTLWSHSEYDETWYLNIASRSGEWLRTTRKFAWKESPYAKTSCSKSHRFTEQNISEFLLYISIKIIAY